MSVMFQPLYIILCMFWFSGRCERFSKFTVSIPASSFYFFSADSKNVGIQSFKEHILRIENFISKHIEMRNARAGLLYTAVAFQITMLPKTGGIRPHH